MKNNFKILAQTAIFISLLSLVITGNALTLFGGTIGISVFSIGIALIGVVGISSAMLLPTKRSSIIRDTKMNIFKYVASLSLIEMTWLLISQFSTPTIVANIIMVLSAILLFKIPISFVKIQLSKVRFIEIKRSL